MNYRLKTPVSDHTAAILNAAKALCQLTSDEALADASARLSLADKQVADVLHQIETANANASDGYKLFSNAQKALVHRRMIKNEMDMINSIRATSMPRIHRLESLSSKAYLPKSSS